MFGSQACRASVDGRLLPEYDSMRASRSEARKSYSHRKLGLSVLVQRRIAILDLVRISGFVYRCNALDVCVMHEKKQVEERVHVHIILLRSLRAIES